MKFKSTTSIVLGLTFLFTASASAADLRPVNLIVLDTTNGSPSSLASTLNGDIWVADWSKDHIQLFSKDASGSAAPLKTIALYPSGGEPSTSTDASSVAVDRNGFVYVADATVNKIFVFDSSASDNQFIGDAVRTINLAHRARVIALDSSGKIYAAGKYNSKLEVRIFSAGITDDSNSPIQTFTDSSTSSTDEPYGLTVLPSGQVAVAWWDQPDIRIYGTTSSGDVSPIKTISGPDTNLGDLGQLASDSLGRIYVWNDGLRTLQIFAPEANGNVAPISSIGFYAISADSIPSVINWGWGLSLGSNSQIWIGTANSLIHFNNPFTIEDSVLLSPRPIVNLTAVAKALEEARARAVLQAKSEVKKTLASGKPLTSEQLIKADMDGVNEKNIGLINDDIVKLPDEKKTDITEVEKVVFKYATVDKVANHSSLSMQDLASIGLVSAESKYKGSISIVLKSLPSESLDTYEKISAAIAAVEKKYADRKAALAALKLRIKTGPKAG